MNDNMEQKYLNKINSEDKRAIRLFINLGISKNVAKTLLYLSQINECRSVDIEQETNLRQPEVSAIIQQLIKKGWIIKRNLRKKRKGRPAQIYKLAFPIYEILIKIEKEKIKEIELIKKNLLSLKFLIERNN